MNKIIKYPVNHVDPVGHLFIFSPHEIGQGSAKPFPNASIRNAPICQVTPLAQPDLRTFRTFDKGYSKTKNRFSAIVITKPPVHGSRIHEDLICRL